MSIKNYFITAAVGLASLQANAQLSKNPDKFLGNITTSGQVDYGKEKYYTLWNQITPENESKWSSVQGSSQTSWNWGGVDNCVNYAKNHNFPFKFHTFVWGSQFPSWVKNLSLPDRYNAIVNWVDGVKKKYAKLAMIDVVNEAIDGHQPDTHYIKDALGGGGKTGYDWLIKAFEMAYERYPNSILIYNDFNTFQWNTDQFITLVQAIRDGGAPIDAYGCQSHDLTDCDLSKLKSSEQKIHNALKMPMYITEYDIQEENDQKQLNDYKDHIPYLWEREYCAGITLWGYIYGATWNEGTSGIYKNGKERAAMTWLREYMASDEAKNAKSPFPDMKKEASIYVRPRELKVAKGDKLPILVRASMATKTIQKIDLYVGDELIATMTGAPYLAEYSVPADAKTGWKDLKAVVTATDGSTYERLSRFNVLSSTEARAPFNETVPTLPGTIKADEYDKGASGVSYNKASRDVTKATQNDGWMEYTVDVKEEGIYSVDMEIASTKTGGTFHLAEYSFDNLTYFTDFIEVPKTGSTTEFQTMNFAMKEPLTAGRHTLCLNIDKGGFCVKSLTFRRYEQDKSIKFTKFTVNPTTIDLGETATIQAEAESPNSTIASIKIFANDLLIGTITGAPFTMEFKPTEKGTYTITAVATDAEGRENASTSKKTLKVNGKREPYSGTPIAIPGIIQAENFDKGGEGLTFHDSDNTREGDTEYRKDGEGVDFVKGNGGTAIGYTAEKEWLEYSIDVQEAGTYQYVATVSSGTSGSGFSIGIQKNGGMITLAKVSVPQTGNNNWDTYKTVEGQLSQNLEVGQQIMRFTITGQQCNIDKVELRCLTSGIHDINNDITITKDAYDLFGRKVNDNYKGIIIRNGKKQINK